MYGSSRVLITAALLEQWDVITMQSMKEQSSWQEYAQRLRPDFPIQTQG